MVLHFGAIPLADRDLRDGNVSATHEGSQPGVFGWDVKDTFERGRQVTFWQRDGLALLAVEPPIVDPSLACLVAITQSYDAFLTGILRRVQEVVNQFGLIDEGKGKLRRAH